MLSYLICHHAFSYSYSKILVRKLYRNYGVLVPFFGNKEILKSQIMVHVLNLFYSDDVKKRSLGFETVNPTKPKKPMKSYITLISVDKNKSITTLEEAKKLSERRNLNLIKVLDLDSKSNRPVYQLMTQSEHIKQDIVWSKSNKEQFIKGHKLVSFSSNISENDLRTKLKMIKNWLSKKNEVRVIISGNIDVGVSIIVNASFY